MNIGARLKELRKSKGLKIKDIVKLTNISQPVISRLENNKQPIDLDYLQCICNALNISLAEFFSPEIKPTDPSLNQLLKLAEKLTIEEREGLAYYLNIRLNNR